MKLNLDTVRTEIDDYLKSAGFVVFYGYARSEDARVVEWDTERHPDYRQFLEVATQLGIKLVVLHQRSFDAAVIDRALQEIESGEMELDDRRTLEARLKELAKYDGFTCSLDLSFDHQDTMYVFELNAQWFEELSDLLSQLDLGYEFEEEDEDQDESYGGYYSRN